MNTLLNYPGSKWGMAAWICSLMPKHRSYLEPFFGSGAVLFHKQPSAIETINDIDGDIVNFFSVLRTQPDELASMIAMTPYARDVFEYAHSQIHADDPLERAYQFAIRSKMGHGFKTYAKTGFKIDVYARENSYAVNCWNRLPVDLLEAAERLKSVQIENRPALDLIRRFNHENVLIYCDPPYLPSTRFCKQYKHEMDSNDHVDLLKTLQMHKGFAMVSGYSSELYNDMLSGWSRVERKSYNQNHDIRQEVLWCNFDLPSLYTEGDLFGSGS